jgi:hypothetical protein
MFELPRDPNLRCLDGYEKQKNYKIAFSGVENNRVGAKSSWRKSFRIHPPSLRQIKGLPGHTHVKEQPAFSQFTLFALKFVGWSCNSFARKAHLSADSSMSLLVGLPAP